MTFGHVVHVYSTPPTVMLAAASTDPRCCETVNALCSFPLPEVSLRGYNVYSLSQSTEMHWLTKGNNEWIVTLDTGRLDYIPAYEYADHDRGKTLMQNSCEQACVFVAFVVVVVVI